MAVIQVDPSRDPRWDAFVEGHPDAVVFQHSAYLRALSREYGQPAVGLMDVDGDTVRGVLPLMWRRGLPVGGQSVVGRRLTSLPRTPLAGPVGSDAALIEEAVAISADAGLQLKPPPGVSLESDRLACRPWRMTYVHELPQDGTLPRFGPSKKHTSLRSALRRIERQGVSVRAAAGV